MRIAALIAAIGISGAALAAPKPFDAMDLVKLDRVGAPVLSPDGQTLAFTVRSTDYEANKAETSVWMLSLAEGSPAKRVSKNIGASNIQWQPDGAGIYFLAGHQGVSQLWHLPVDGGSASALSSLPLDINSFRLSPDGQRVLLSIDIFTDCEKEQALACTHERLEQREVDPATGMLYDQMFVRHWSQWSDGRRSQLFIADLGNDGRVGQPRWLTSGLDGDIPSKPFGSSAEFVFGPDGESIYFNLKLAGASEPWSTDFDIYRLSLDGSSDAQNLTGDNDAWDAFPLPSPDGRTLYYLAMSVPGFESDRFAIMALDLSTGESREVAPDWDRSAGPMRISHDGKALYTSANDEGNHPLFAVDIASGSVETLLGKGKVTGFDVEGDTIVAGHQDLQHPTDLYLVGAEAPEQLTHFNREALENVEFGEPDWFWFKGWNGKSVQGFVVKPAGYEEGRQYPVAFLIHGGPQGAWTNDFHYRWNPQTYAGQGFAVVGINFHGSTGYGQNFTDSISQHWGDRPLEDLQKGWAAALQKYPFLDEDRACALGASYGGYMVNWIASQWNEPWRCMINHNGIFDTRNMYYATEELWFMEHEHGGTQYEHPAAYEKFNPINHVADWNVPMLVIHSDHDYRIPLSEGLATFTALQRQGIPSQFLRFPDETHWVAKPHNSVQWHNTVNDWLKRWTEADRPGD